MARLAIRLFGIAAASALVLGLTPYRGELVIAHEWGTFTTVAGEDGRSEQWMPLSGVVDLPCFVEVLGGRPGPIVGKVAGARIIRTAGVPPKGVFVEPRLAPTYDVARQHLVGTVRMETPVIYFYADERTNVRVEVDFPDGLVTEWYPDATVEHDPIFTGEATAKLRSSLVWPSVDILPDRKNPMLRSEGRPSHYYPARETDAAPVQVFGKDEKFLFYRGVGDFEVPIIATENDEGGIDVTNAGAHPIPSVILFERRGEEMGFRVLEGALDGSVTIPPVKLKQSSAIPSDALDAAQAELRAALKAMIMDAGMYEREAEAMLETWKDSWFEEGARLFYLMPQAAVDEILPLTIEPAPRAVARAFVGRVELITRRTIETVERAIEEGDDATLLSYGRFLSPITDRMLAGSSAEVITGARAEMTALYDAHVKRVEAGCR